MVRIHLPVIYSQRGAALDGARTIAHSWLQHAGMDGQDQEALQQLSCNYECWPSPFRVPMIAVTPPSTLRVNEKLPLLSLVNMTLW